MRGDLPGLRLSGHEKKSGLLNSISVAIRKYRNTIFLYGSNRFRGRGFLNLENRMRSTSEVYGYFKKL